jgi:hypothetical protein
MKSKNMLIGLLAFTIILCFSSCAPEGYESNKSGFFGGIWHGLILGFSLIGKLFGADIGIYAEHNTGFTYWLGFILGIGGFGGGLSSARR